MSPSTARAPSTRSGPTISTSSAKQLDAAPLYVGGSSAGARLAILFAIRHPDALRGLLLWRVTGGQEAVDRLAENYYGQFIKIAQAGGMQAVAKRALRRMHRGAAGKPRTAPVDRMSTTSSR